MKSALRNLFFIGIFISIMIMGMLEPQSIQNNPKVPISDRIAGNFIQEVPKSAGNGPQIDEFFNGTAGTLNYTIESEGIGNDTFVNLYSPTNTSQILPNSFISLPSNSLMRRLNVTLDDIEYHNQTAHLGNDTVTYTPKYQIIYSNNTIPSNTSWINLTVQDYPEARIGNINISVDGNLNKTFIGAGIHQHGMNFTLEGQYLINVTLWFTNNTLAAYENFTISYKATDPATTLERAKRTPALLNPFVRLNDQAGNNRSLAINFTVPYTANLTTIEVFGRFNLYYLIFQYNLGVTIRKNNISGQIMSNTIYTRLVPQTNPDWIPIYNNFNGVTLPAGEYYLILDGSGITNNAGNNYFDCFMTTNARTNIQNGSAFDGTSWNPLSQNLLFRYQTDFYRPTDLTELNISVSVIGNQIPIQIQSFNPMTNSALFEFIEGWPNTDLPRFQFTANASARLNYSFIVDINQTLPSNPLNFTANLLNHVQWETRVNATKPSVETNRTFFLWFNYTLFFPQEWFFFNATNNSQFITSSEPLIVINSSVSSLIWIFRASSNHSFAEISGDRVDYSKDLDITISVRFASTQYFAEVSMWNATFNSEGIILPFTTEYLNYTINRTRDLLNSSYTVDFTPPYHIPANFNNSILTVRLYWHNETAVGIILKNFTLKVKAQLNSTFGFIAEIKPNTNATLGFTYQTMQNESISDPIRNVSGWLVGNYSWTYQNNRHILNLFAANLTPGERDIIIIFNHSQYLTQTLTIKIYILVPTVLELKAGDTQIYYGQNFDIYFAWYINNGSKITYSAADPDVIITYSLDNVPLSLPNSEYIIGYTTTYPNANVHALIYTYTFKEDMIGQHFFQIRFQKQNASLRYEYQQYTFYFQIMPVNTKIELNYVDISYANIGNWVEFQGRNTPIEVSFNYYYTNVIDDILQPISFFKYEGRMFAYLYELSSQKRIGDELIFTSLNNGTYHTYFDVSGLDPSLTYMFHVYTNNTNFARQEWDIPVNLASRWKIEVIFTPPQTLMEGSPLVISGQMFFKNASHRWAARNVTLNIMVIFWSIANDKSRNMTSYNETFAITTDQDGYFFDNHIIVANWRYYDYINVTYVYVASVQNNPYSSEYRVEIEMDWFNRIIVPILIAIAILGIGIPLTIKVVIPIAREYIPQTRTYKSFQKTEFFKKLAKKSQPKTLSDIACDDIECEVLRIPMLDPKVESATQFDKKTDPSFEILKIPKEHKPVIQKDSLADKVRNLFKQTLRELELFIGINQEIPDLKAKKEAAMINGFLAFSRGMAFEAALNFFYARKYAEQLKLEQEASMMEQNFARAFSRLPAKQKKLILQTLSGI